MGAVQTAIHEIGHCLGLDEAYTKTNCGNTIMKCASSPSNNYINSGQVCDVLFWSLLNNWKQFDNSTPRSGMRQSTIDSYEMLKKMGYFKDE
jgi:hypothetical protein